jgi:hypothetical protein
MNGQAGVPMVHVPTRLSEEHDVPVRLGPSITNVPEYGPPSSGGAGTTATAR